MIENFRDYRSKKLNKVAKVLITAGIKANHLTALSLFSGLTATYFLFNHYFLFVLLVLLHLCFDGLDGVVARLTKTTTKGKYFDLLSDSTVTFLAILKVGIYLQDFYAYLAAGLFLVALLIHTLSKFQAPMIFMRTASLIVLIVATHPFFPLQNHLLTLGYLVAGGVSLFSLARQLQWRMNHGQSR